jgi:Initiator Replication protein
VAGSCDREGHGKPGSLRDVQCAVRAHLAGIQEAPAKKYVEAGNKTVSLEELRRVLGLESVKDADGNVIHEAPMPVWANFRQRALEVAILEISAKTDLKIKLMSIERSKYRRVVALDFAIKAQAIPKGATRFK